MNQKKKKNQLYCVRKVLMAFLVQQITINL